ncbi:MAG: hypothetical protein WBQ34_13000 [Candidatus Acidiferrales bacterium]
MDMANPITGAYEAQQTPQVSHPTQAANTTSKPVGSKSAASEDTVTISKAGQAASQAHQAAAAQTQQTGSDGDHDGK